MAITKATASSVAPAAAGDLVYGSGTNDAAVLALGTAGQVLTVNAGATAPEWGTISSGGMTLITTTNASGATSVSFTSIPTTYKHLLLIWEDVFNNVSTDVYWNVRFNNDSGSDYRYFGVIRQTNGALNPIELETNDSIGGNFARAPIMPTGNSDQAQGNSFGQLWIYDYANSTTRKGFRLTTTSKSAGGNDNVHFMDTYGAYLDSGKAAITQIDFIRSSTQTLTGTFKLYGVS